VSFASWLVEGVTAAAARAHGGYPLTASGDAAGVHAARWTDLADDWFSLSSLALPFVATGVSALWIVVLVPRSRWSAATLTTLVLAGTTLLMSVGDGLVRGHGGPVGYGLTGLYLTVLTLELPACFALSAWLCVPMRVVPRRAVGRRVSRPPR
jgi:hypothetical protein